MAWGSKQEELVEAKAEVKFLREAMKEKNEELERLRLQLERTQLALIAKEAPEAYQDRKFSEERRSVTPEEQQELEKRRQIARASQILLDEMEGPMFRDADDMHQMLNRVLNRPPESLHGDGES